MRGTLLRTRSFLASAALGAALCGLAGSAHAQTDEQRAGARSLATEGAVAFNEGRFKDAVELFGKAESLVHAPPHLLFMARAHAKLGQFVKAREAYMKIVKEQLPANAPQAFRDAQVTAEEERKQVEPHIGRLVIKVEGAEGAKDLSVAVNGQPVSTVLLGVPQPMDPGEHTVTATATGFKAAPARVSLKDAGSGAVTIRMEVDGSVPPPGAAPAAPAAPGAVMVGRSDAPPSDAGTSGGSNGMRIGSYVGFGVGAVGIALGTVFVLKSSSHRKDADEADKALQEQCGRQCDATSPEARNVADLDDKARSAKTIGIVGYVVGGVGVAAGVTLFVLSNDKAERKSAFVAPYVGLGAVGVRGAF
jgi:tetratricopeptide (TPR) repeat protein